MIEIRCCLVEAAERQGAGPKPAMRQKVEVEDRDVAGPKYSLELSACEPQARERKNERRIAIPARYVHADRIVHLAFSYIEWADWPIPTHDIGHIHIHKRGRRLASHVARY